MVMDYDDRILNNIVCWDIAATKVTGSGKGRKRKKLDYMNQSQHAIIYT